MWLFRYISYLNMYQYTVNMDNFDRSQIMFNIENLINMIILQLSTCTIIIMFTNFNSTNINVKIEKKKKLIIIYHFVNQIKKEKIKINNNYPVSNLFWGSATPSFQPPQNRKTNYRREMVKKRDLHRSPPTSGRRENQIKPSSRRPELTHSASSSGTIKVVGFFIASSLIATVTYWLTQSSPSQNNESYVYERGLVTTDTNYQDILAVSITITTLWNWSFTLLYSVIEDSKFWLLLLIL
jgi:hypothetical protein